MRSEDLYFTKVCEFARSTYEQLVANKEWEPAKTIPDKKAPPASFKYANYTHANTLP